VNAPVEQVSHVPRHKETFEKPQQRVLVVEDEELLRALLVEILSSFGYEVMEAEDGQAALKTLESVNLDLLITDMSMPKVSGPALAQRVRDLRPEMKILFVSGLPEDELGPLLKTGSTYFLQKPFRGGALLEKVRDIFSH
jgi:two-component system cell cycle sensor histidine kinase/response regulator CckA